MRVGGVITMALVTQPAAPPTRIAPGAPMSLSSTTHALGIGLDNSANLAFDTNDIQARFNGGETALGINPFGGDLTLGSTASAVTLAGRLRLPSTQPASLPSGLHPLQVGPTTGVNLALDGNQVQARNAGAGAPLYLNYYGGAVNAGGALAVTGGVTASGDVNASGNISGNSFYGVGEARVGLASGTHTVLNVNQLRAEEGGAVATLYLNYGGGDLEVFGAAARVASIRGTLRANNIVFGRDQASGGPDPAYQEAFVPFGTAFTNTPGVGNPTVVICPISSSNTVIKHMVRDISTTGFTARILRNSTTATEFNWIAIR